MSSSFNWDSGMTDLPTIPFFKIAGFFFSAFTFFFLFPLATHLHAIFMSIHCRSKNIWVYV